MLSGLEDQINDYYYVKINIDGRQFVIDRRVLMERSGSFFDNMLAGNGDHYIREDGGPYTIQYAGSNFHLIYDYLVSNSIPSRRDDYFDNSFYDEANFYGLIELRDRFIQQERRYYRYT